MCQLQQQCIFTLFHLNVLLYYFLTFSMANLHTLNSVSVKTDVNNMRVNITLV